ncbi:MAG: hypothetical protein FWF46_07985 [Oscillospiraceae bacterium]|nr:hypothetical protein [Oscillospiraceae bacterium]
MATKTYYYCRPVTLRGEEERTIDVQSAIITGCYSYQLSYVGAEFVRNAGNNAMAFIKEPSNVKLLLLCNKETGEMFIPDSYSEIERVEIRQQFVRYMFYAFRHLNNTEELPQVLLDN